METLLKISDAAALGVHAAAVLSAHPGEPRSTGSVARALDASEAHLAKVFQRLARAGLVHSVRGPRGGFALTRPSADITLMQVYEAIDGPFAPKTCLLGGRVCGGRACVLGDLLKSLNEQVRAYLTGTTLAAIGPVVSEGALP